MLLEERLEEPRMFAKGFTFGLKRADLPDFLDDPIDNSRIFIHASSDRKGKPWIHGSSLCL
jgi:hypothetical protein